MFDRMTARHGDRILTLQLTMLAMADLQDKYGADLGPLGAINADSAPPFRAMVDVVAAALRRHHRDIDHLSVADDLLTDDLTIFARLMAVSFPQPEGAGEPGNGQAAT
ncbi:hypothetical protein ACEYYA_00940 [Paracoccus sp. p3-h83]|uniref:hypothetical protein n=1 Tax=Paracoccus sp. p3-h83 TaxID=3342805 RepID=UPI0035BA5830